MNFSWSKIVRIKRFLGPRVWKLFIFSIFLGLFLFAVESSFVFVMQGFLRTIGFVENKQLLLPSWYPTQLTPAMLLLFLFGIFRGIIYMARYYIIGAIGEIFATLQRQRILEYGLRYAESVSSGNILSLFSERVTHSSGVLQSISQLLVTTTACFLFFLYGLKKAPVEMLIGVFALLILMIPLKKFNKSITSSGNGLRQEWTKVNNLLIQGLRNHFFFKIYNLVELEIKKAQEYLKIYDKHFLRFYKVSALKNHTPNIIGILIICSISFVSVRYIHTRPVILISFFYIFIRFTQGLSEASTGFSNLKLHFESFKELFYWHEKLEQSNLTIFSRRHESSLTENPFLNSVEINVQHLAFGFPNKPILLKDINFSIKKGEVLLVKGPSGVGKSTLLTLLLGLLKPGHGSICYNGHHVDEAFPYISQIIGYVGPEPYIIVGTIKENILLGIKNKSEITDEMIKKSLEKAQLDFPEFDLNFFVAEQATLSTGQKQRLSIARAILRKPKLLIFDEATANLDGETEEKFIENIKDLLKEVTAVIISHKSSFDQLATTVLTLHPPEEHS